MILCCEIFIPFSEKGMQVTVLMPIYNAEKFLHDSIGSLLAQTSDQWKLICIDDGSTDNSRKILEEYCQKDNRIRLICQENAGPAVARARAIEIADTEYVSILDSDDAYAPDYVELMLKRSEDTDADIVVPDVEFGYGNTMKLPNKFASSKLNTDMIITDGKQAFDMTVPWKLHGWQMVRTSLAKKYYTVEQASYSKFNSDEYITRLLYLKSNKVALCKACYKYRIDPNSITRKPTLKRLDYLVTLDKLVDLCYRENVWMHTRVEVFNDYYVTLIGMNDFIAQLPEVDRTKARKMVEKAYHNSYRKKLSLSVWMAAPFRTKVKFAISLISLNSLLGGAKSKIREWYYGYLKWYRTKTIRNRDVTIISNNCWGGFMYQSCELQYNSPTIGLYFFAPEYIKFLRNLKGNLHKPLHFIPKSESRYAEHIPQDYLIGVLGDTDIEIVFMHYDSKEEVTEKWTRRTMRVDFDNMIVKFSDTDFGCTDELIEEFDKLPFKNKVCFTHKPFPQCKSVIYMPEYKENEYVLYEWAYSYRYYNFVKKANKIANE